MKVATDKEGFQGEKSGSFIKEGLTGGIGKDGTPANMISCP